MVTFIYDNLVFICCLSKNGEQLSQPSFLFSFLFPPSLRYNITHSSNLNFYLGIIHLKKKTNIISSFMLQERPLSLKLIFPYYNQINRQRDRVIWMMNILTNFLSFLVSFFFSLYCFCSWSILVSCFLFFSFFSSSFLPAWCLPLFFFSFLSFFSRQSVHLFVARLFLFFSFYFFNSSIFLSPFRLCRVVMLKTVVYGNQVHSESLKSSAGTGTKLIYVIWSSADSCRNIHIYAGYIPMQ